MYSFTANTKAKFELINITAQIDRLVAESKIESGFALVFIPHTTAGIICNEDEARLKNDILQVIKTLKEKSRSFGGFAHDADEGNAAAHIVAALSGNSRSFIVRDGRLGLGTWQSVMLLEMDGPRPRKVWVKIIPHPS